MPLQKAINVKTIKVTQMNNMMMVMMTFQVLKNMSWNISPNERRVRIQPTICEMVINNWFKLSSSLLTYHLGK